MNQIVTPFKIELNTVRLQTDRGSQAARAFHLVAVAAKAQNLPEGGVLSASIQVQDLPFDAASHYGQIPVTSMRK